MHFGKRMPNKSDIITLDFQRVDFPQMRLLMRRLKWKVKGVESLQGAWRPFKTIIHSRHVYLREGKA